MPLEALAGPETPAWLGALIVEHEPALLASAIIAATTVYVVLGGLFSVVVTDVIQTVILTLGSLFIAAFAWMKLTPELLANLPEGFPSLAVPWRIPSFAAGGDNAEFELFGALVIVWVVKGLLLNAGGPGQMYDFQRFLSARHPRDAAKMGAAWSGFLIVRWAMAMGLALLAVTGAVGAADPERVMPLVLRDFLPSGIRGLVLAGLLAAFMSTFSSTVNAGASFLVRDLWQPWIRPNATDREAVRASYFATVLLVLAGILIGVQGESIASIFSWIMMALGGGVIVPNVLRWYWWRMNGWGYSLGVLAGMALSLAVLFHPDAPAYAIFPLIAGASLIVSVLASLLTRPVDAGTLQSFYATVRPFGAWKPVREGSASGTAGAAGAMPASEGLPLAALNVTLGMVAIAGAYLAPMYLVGHWYRPALLWLGVCLAASIVLKYTWYANLPEETP